MRGLLGLLAVVVLLLIVGVATGFINIGQTQTAELPEIKAEGGQLPKFDADVGDVDVGTKTETVEVPTIDIDTANKDAREDKDK